MSIDAVSPAEPPDADGAIVSEGASANPRMGLPALAIAILFGLFYAYDLFAAVSNLVGLPVALTGQAVPWIPLIVGVLVAPAAFVISFWVGRRQRTLVRALIFLVGLAVSAVLSLSLEGYVQILLR